MISAEDIATWQGRDEMPDDPPGRGGTAYRTVPMSDTGDKIAWLRAGGDCDPPCKSMVAADGCTCALAADALARAEAAEADRARFLRCMDRRGEAVLELTARAGAAEKEVARLRQERDAAWRQRATLDAETIRLRAALAAERAETADLKRLMGDVLAEPQSPDGAGGGASATGIPVAEQNQ